MDYNINIWESFIPKYKFAKEKIEAELKVELTWSYLWFHQHKPNDYDESVSVDVLTSQMTDEQLMFRICCSSLFYEKKEDVYTILREKILEKYQEWIYR